MQVDVLPPAKINIGDKFGKVRSPVITLYDSIGNKLVHETVRMKIVNIFGCILKDRPICDAKSRAEIENTIEHIRLSEICGISVQKAETTTNEQGTASFSETMVTK